MWAVQGFRLNEQRRQPLLQDDELKKVLNSLGQKGFQPDFYLYTSLLKSCGNAKDLQGLRRVHADISASEHRPNRFLGNLLLEMYGKSGSVEDARNVFDGMYERNLVSWNLLIKAYAQNGHGQDALELYAKMDAQGVQPDMFTFVSILGACSGPGALADGEAIYARIVANGFDSHMVMGTALINMFTRCGNLSNARRVFNRLPKRDVVSWTAMVSGYAQNGYLDDAKSLFDRMPKRDIVSWNAMIAAYVQHGDLGEARKLFDEMSQRDAVSWNTMVAAYAQKGHFEEAKCMFERMPHRTLVSWNTIIEGYIQNGHLQEARTMFDEMPQKDVVSWTAMVNAYAQSGQLEEAKCIFDKMPQRNVVSWTAMIAAYARNGHVEEARNMFDSMTHKDVAAWSSMIALYAQNSQTKEALALFRLMDLEGVQLSKSTIVGILDAFKGSAGLVEGKLVHASVCDTRFQSDVAVNNSLINMYGKCGSLFDARSVFNSMQQHDIVSWNAMIAAYAENGHGNEALELFQGMSLEGVQPDEITYMSILSVCSHAGLIEAGRAYFCSITGDYAGLDSNLPTVDHFVCMIDLLARVGRLKDAVDLVNGMPFEPDAVAWMTLLSACKLHGDTGQGFEAAEYVLKLDPESVAAYVLSSNIYKLAHENNTQVQSWRPDSLK